MISPTAKAIGAPSKSIVSATVMASQSHMMRLQIIGGWKIAVMNVLRI